MDVTLISLLGLGLLLGLRHAFDPDHIAAVSTIVVHTDGWRRSSLIGTCWGLGHSLALLATGLLVLFFKFEISGTTELWFEFAVALMLIVLGLQAILRASTGWRVHLHRHSHDGNSHVHVHLHTATDTDQHRHKHLIRTGLKPFAVGLLHGLAGSGALMLLVLATIPSAAVGIIYIVVFGIGSIGGMLLMSVAISLPFLLQKNRFAKLDQLMQGAAGLISAGFGFFLIWEYSNQMF